MKTAGESLVSFATHAAACKRDSGGSFGLATTTFRALAGSAVDRAEVLMDALVALDASDRVTDVGFDSPYLRWTHTPVDGDPYTVTVELG